jgi:hypothetical protein
MRSPAGQLRSPLGGLETDQPGQVLRAAELTQAVKEFEAACLFIAREVPALGEDPLGHHREKRTAAEVAVVNPGVDGGACRGVAPPHHVLCV